jgi:glutaredoxin 3
MENPPVTIYLTESCSYCGAARMLLTKKGLRYEERVVSRDPDLRDEMVKRTGKTSVPQIFIRNQYVGGFDELYALDSSGELDKLLATP